jgi:arginyl-tRNA--protein-N-Asp/Glu arginylyltransferase
MHKQQTPDKCSQSWVYKLTCPDCSKAYVGRTGGGFRARFNEHRNTYRFNHRTSNFATHLIEESHSFGPIHNTIQILKRHTKGTHLNTIEQFYIYAEYVNNNHLNDKHTVSSNSIFEALLKTQPAINPPPPL